MHRSMFFGRPKIWNRLQAPVEQKKITKLHEQMYYHKAALVQVKAVLGKYCTFLAHVVENDIPSFKAVIVKDGEKKPIFISAEKPFKDFLPEDYKDLKDVLYEQIRSKENV